MIVDFFSNQACQACQKRFLFQSQFQMFFARIWKLKMLPWYIDSPRPKQLCLTSLRIIPVFPDPGDPVMMTPRFVGRSDERWSTISRKSHCRPTKFSGPPFKGSQFGTSKKRGFKVQYGWRKPAQMKHCSSVLWKKEFSWVYYLDFCLNHLTSSHFIIKHEADFFSNYYSISTSFLSFFMISLLTTSNCVS